MFHTKNILNRMMGLSLLASMGFVALLSLAQTAPVLAATAPPLGTTSTYGVVSSTFTNTVAGSTINGDVCYTTGPAVMPTITGVTVVPCPGATGTDQNAALADLNAQACTSLGGGAIALDTVNIGGGPGVFTPGCYSSGGAMDITLSTTVTLNGAGVYIFRPNGALTTGANSHIILAGGACESDVFWGPTATTLGANTTFVGTLIQITDITIGSTVNFKGRALAYGHTVTIDTDTITVPTCAAFGTTPVPTLSEWGVIIFMVLAGLGSVYYLRRKRREA